MITPDELIARAEILSEQNSEIEWRDSIKHAYYYLYHLAKEFADENGIGINVERQNLGEHQYLIERFKSSDSKIAKALARDMQMLKDKRTQCCYFLSDKVPKMTACQQVLAAKHAVKRLDSLQPEHN